MTPAIYDADVCAERMTKRDRLIRARQQRDHRMMWLTVAIAEVVLSITLELLEVSMGVIVIVVCVILLVAIFLDFIEKRKQKRQADERAEQIQKFVGRQL
jgi:Flp pilus assembly protein TadB